jgi:hypothetical protein
MQWWGEIKKATIRGFAVFINLGSPDGPEPPKMLFTVN